MIRGNNSHGPKKVFTKVNGKKVTNFKKKMGSKNSTL